MIGASELRIFLETAKVLNITRSAERLGLSQPALSQAIKRIEDQLGVELFLRSKKGLKLTRSGEKLQSRGRDMVLEWENLHRSLIEDEENVAGLFRLGVHPSVAMYTVTEFLPVLQAEHPLIDLQLRHGLSRHVAEDLISGRIDIGLVVNPPPHPDLVIRDVLKDEVALWAHPKRRSSETLILDPELLQSQWLLRELEKRKLLFPRRLETSSLEVARELTARGCGVGLLPGRVATLHSGLTRVHPEVPGYRDRICLAYRVDQEKTAAFRALVTTITKSLGEK